MPGKKPRFFDILGDAKEFVIYHTGPDKYLWQMNFFDVLRRRTEEYGKQKLYCLWITYMPFVMIVKAEAVKEFMEKKINEKNFLYKWMEPILGTGLLTRCTDLVCTKDLVHTKSNVLCQTSSRSCGEEALRGFPAMSSFSSESSSKYEVRPKIALVFL
ncbi:hypothetical protein AVEN_241472-1 [Araneus ventricosus]|uniref:Uncharacterized protein n=1 Tax=Araneus ventricosus TaxID=182803 RepID=A0A4Y2FJ93_ARAVE|nr:hypothetical protein AVEN_241472-1 [Araneus ventricosus]